VVVLKSEKPSRYAEGARYAKTIAVTIAALAALYPVSKRPRSGSLAVDISG